ncbi:uncharacterized protein LOC129711657 [Leucoraja erinacea]|uniref:uncharacterized protein LOC129711657 n=1 Tax=Leucoraja erinaceus TaxID=7782 RepID=UPI002453C8DD|nr:uncharacterized protein LOC129711657 [Leucoraja erinacea]
MNSNQRDGSCQDYRIRFTCPDSFCGVTEPPVGNCKTPWFDRDNPAGIGDYEIFPNLRTENPGQICTDPIACEVETTSGIPASQTGENIASCNVSTGFFCKNSNQRDRACQDYRIRFTCPDSFCDVTEPPVGNCKTDWFDRDNPSGFGDYELLTNLRSENPGQICMDPIACEVETTSGIPASQTGENIASCNASTGFFCVNSNQRDGACQDYRIRFTCPESFCNCKTQWFDRDDPTGHGDYEVITNLRNENPGVICPNPIACEVETLSGIPASSSGDIVSNCNVISGFICVNAEQTDGRCEDYRIRFICPESFCNCKTQWFDRDDPTGYGDYENLANLRKENPGLICPNPTACEVETLSGIPASSSGNIVSNCNVISGFTCVNAEQTDGRCEDYRIRFTCPDSFCNCKTQWFDRDDPSGHGDYEDLTNLRNENPDLICPNPTSCEVETLSGIPASSSGDIVSNCNVFSGFACVNAEQTDGQCEDYRIRFTCPESFCNCRTQWFDRDDPSGHGDYEVLTNLRNENPGLICPNPTGCEVETLSGIPASSSGDIVSSCSIISGFLCVNAEQSDGRCEDYRIRFICPESFCNCRTEWFDRDDPSGFGDYEDLTILRKQYPNHICNNPTACEVETVSGVPASSTGDIISECSILSGFICLNSEQMDGQCEDYRIRFICPESFCNCKTEWFDRDDATGKGDFETLANLQMEYPGRICSNPSGCEVETVSGIPASDTGDNITPCNAAFGFTCNNEEQSDGLCEDYRIRFTCPESFCNCVTQWFDRDDPSGIGDFEDLENLRKAFPDQICSNPTACEVQTIAGIPASSSGNNIPQCSISTGFTCINVEQKNGKCEDYRIRFTCPESFCDCKTPWFDRDDPSGKGDYENLQSLQKENPNKICSNPTACEVQTTDGEPASSTGDIIPVCDVSNGFVCENADQKINGCHDYRIRFTCPQSFCGKKTPWFDRDNPTGQGDFEDLVNLRKENPNQICSKPIACEVQTVGGKPPSSTNDNIPECSILTGFVCLNKDQTNGACEDYKIRFTCP